MNVYIYQADLLCEKCGEECRTELTAAGNAPEDPSDESSYDSDDFPKGPTEEGEADAPSYCSDCGVFLETDLTSDGEAYVRKASGACAEEWRAFYSYLFQDEPEETIEDYANHKRIDLFSEHGSRWAACLDCGASWNLDRPKWKPIDNGDESCNE